MNLILITSFRITMQSQQRRAPHWFNLLRQICVLEKNNTLVNMNDLGAHFDAIRLHHHASTMLCPGSLSFIGQTWSNNLWIYIYISVIYSLTSPHVIPSTQAWDCELSIWKALAIGKTEAKAVVQLHQAMIPTVRDMLESAVHESSA